MRSSYSSLLDPYNHLQSPSKISNRKPLELVIDSSGLKVFGEGEWKVKIHGSDKRRGWVNLHIAADPKTQELISIELTDDKTADSTVLPHSS